MNPFCDLVGINIPIVQAPIGSLAGPELVAEVSNAGGLGGFGATWTTRQDLKDRIAAKNTKSNKPYFVNLALSFPPDNMDVINELKVPVVTFSWGISDECIHDVKRYGGIVGVQSGSVAGAKLAIDTGADFVILQGLEAGGHVQSTKSVWDLLDEARRAGINVPIVAAGGISTPQQIARALRSGASAVMMGTIFVASAECLAHKKYKSALIAATSNDTVLTICFDGGWPHAPHRVLRNSTFRNWESAGCLPPGRRPGEGDEIAFSQIGEAILRYEDTAPSAKVEGNIEAMCLYSGTGVDAVARVLPASQVVKSIWQETQSLLTS